MRHTRLPTDPQHPRFRHKAALPQRDLFVLQAQWKNLALNPGQMGIGRLPLWEVQECEGED